MEEKLKIKFKSLSGEIPKYETKFSAGLDLKAYLPENNEIILDPGERGLINTGLYMELPPGFEAQVRARSGIAIKYGVGLVNGIGTIDADYRGEIKIPLINWGNEKFKIKNGDRIAQLVIANITIIEPVLAENISDTERGKGGFGHTGIR